MKKFVVVVLVVLLIPSAAFAWDDCPRGETYCGYPGICGRYVDTNDDGLCDHSQPAPGTGDLHSSASEIDSTDSTSDDLSISSLLSSVDEIPCSNSADSRGAILEVSNEGDGSNPQPAFGGRKQVYHLLPITGALVLLYLLSHVLSKKSVISVATHRKIWNVMLLVTFLVSVILGLFLILRINFGMEVPLPFNTLFWHVEAGVVMGVICVFHIVWHWKYFKKMLKAVML